MENEKRVEVTFRNNGYTTRKPVSENPPMFARVLGTDFVKTGEPRGNTGAVYGTLVPRVGVYGWREGGVTWHIMEDGAADPPERRPPTALFVRGEYLPMPHYVFFYTDSDGRVRDTGTMEEARTKAEEVRRDA